MLRPPLPLNGESRSSRFEASQYSGYQARSGQNWGFRPQQEMQFQFLINKGGDSCLYASLTPHKKVFCFIIFSIYSFKSEIWSIGIAFYMLIHGHYPFPDSPTIQDYLSIILTHKVKFDKKKCSKPMISLLQKMLECSPDKRVDTKGIMEHPTMFPHLEEFRAKLRNCLKMT